MRSKLALRGLFILSLFAVVQALATHPSTMLLDRLNAGNGAYSYSRTDIEVPGPVPLAFRRNYSSEQIGHDMLGLGHQHGLALRLGEKGVDKHGCRFRVVDFPGGKQYCFLAKKPSKDGQRTYYITPSEWGRSDGNRRGDEPSRFPHIKNCRLISTKRADGRSDWVLFLPDGTERLYVDALVREEILPTGNRICYEYDEQQRLTRLVAWDSSKYQELGSLAFSYRTDKMLVRGSNGHKVTYCFTSKKDGVRLLTQVLKSHGRDETLRYKKDGDKEKPYILSCLEREGGQRLEMDYFAGDRWLRGIRVPQARKSGMFTAYKMRPDFDEAWSDVTNPLGGLTRYRADRRGRIERVERLDENGGVYSAKTLGFAENSSYHELRGVFAKPNVGQVTYSGIEDANGVLIARSYKYDECGNLTKERLQGNLTGDAASDYIQMGRDSRPVRATTEYYSSKYRYSNDGRHLLTEEWDHNGTRVEYRYEATRPLKTAKFVYDGDQRIRRSFFTYDALGQLTEEMHDDGCDEDRHCLAGVTQRTRRRYERQMDPGEVGLGLPLVERDAYYDVARAKFRLIKRTVYGYDRDSRVTSKAVYNAKKRCLSSEAYTYDRFGNMTGIRDALGSHKCFEYDERGNKVLEQVVSCGCSTHHEYDARGNVIATEQVDCDGNSERTSFQYDAMGNRRAEIDSMGRRTDYHYDAHGRLVRTEFPALLDEERLLYRPIEQNSYDAADRVIATTDHTGAVTRYRYNARDQKIEQIFPDASVESWRYSLDGHVKLHKQRDGSYSKFDYDRQGRVTLQENYAANGELSSWEKRRYASLQLLEVETSTGLHTSYRYAANGQLKEKRTEGAGVYERVEYAYDALARVTRERAYASKREDTYVDTLTTYDKAGRKVSCRVRDAKGVTQAYVRYDYDAHGRQCSVSRAVDEHEWQSNYTAYDCQGRVRERQDAEGHIELISYPKHESQGETWQQELTRYEDGSTLLRTLDAAGRELSMERKDSDGERCSLKTTRYDKRGEKAREAHQILSGGVERGWKVFHYQYDPNGQLREVSVKEPGKPTLNSSHDYDPQQRLRFTRNELDQTLDYSYDEIGRLVACTSSDGAIDEVYGYDDKQRLVGYENRATKVKLGRSYDAHGRVSSETLANGHEIEFSYNGYGKIRSVRLPNGERLRYRYSGAFVAHIDRLGANGETLYRYSVQERDLRGRILSEKLPRNAGSLMRSWDACNRPLSIRHNHWRMQVGEHGYGFDGRLLSCEQGPTAESKRSDYAYDALGQLSRESGDVVNSYVHNSLGERVGSNGLDYVMNEGYPVELGDRRYSYDRCGNMLTRKRGDKHCRYKYNARKQVSRVIVNGNERYDYGYDHEGRRLTRRHMRKRSNGSWAHVATQYFLYCGQHEIGVMDENGKLQELRVLANPDTNALPVAVAFELNGQRCVPIHDATGSVRCLLDMETGRELQHYSYSAYGECSTTSARGCDLKNPWRFQSQRWDAASGCYQFPQRSYEPLLGRWCSPDPLGSLDGPSLFAFAHNRPLTEIDPLGLWGVSLDFSYGADGWNVKVDCAPGAGVEHVSFSMPLAFIWETASWMGALGTHHAGVVRKAPEGHPAEVIAEASDGSCMYIVPGKSIQRGAMMHVNGMSTSFETAYSGAERLSDIGGGREVLGVHNASHGFAADVVECYLGLNGYATDPAYMVAAGIESFHSLRPADHKLLISSHSQGSIHTMQALKMVSPEARDRVIAVSLGSAWPIEREYCNQAYNFASKSDPIPYLRGLVHGTKSPWSMLQFLTTDGNSQLTRVPRHSGASSYFDHGLTSPSTETQYINVVLNYIDEFDQ